MKLAVTTERHADETRVAISPDTVKRFVALGVDVVVESGAGRRAGFADDAYRAQGANVVEGVEGVLGGADVVLSVRRPDPNVIGAMRAGALLVGQLAPHAEREGLKAIATAGITAFSMELLPRISRAQSMDVLSSQANLAGYKAVVDAAAELDRAFPMMMTAAGTIAPARVFVLGAGVAGLQAIATARRLGAIVSATDVRPAVKEQVESLGASFVMVDSEETREAETAGGYAKEMSDDYKRAQAALVAEHLKTQDVVITTALIPGRPAPVLITEEMVDTMKPGALIVDLAVEQGGNCPLSRVGEIAEHGAVRIMGHANVPGRIPVDASSLYARNLFNFISPFVDKESGALALDWDDELVTGTAITRDGEIVHPMLRDASG